MKRQLYHKLSAREFSIPLFSQAWWLDAVCGSEHWDVALIEKQGELVGAMPYFFCLECGFRISKMPPLTQTLGPWLRPSNAKSAKRLSQQKKWMTELIEQLPHFARFSQNWHYSQQNWLPFYWKGFQQTTRYTYVLPHLEDEKRLWEDLGANIRGDIRKASGRFNLRVRDDLDIDIFLELNKKVFERQGRSVPYSEELIRRLDKACHARKSRKILIAEDPNGRLHAGIYLVWDQNSAYYLMGGSDPDLRGSGASSLCMWDAIRFAATVTKKFDFEGSMIQPVERFFRAFGACQTPYFSVTRTSSRLYRAALILRSFM